MSDRFDPGRWGDWVVFCDICGQKCYASEASKLSEYTGRGGLIVCPRDVDKIDYGLVPYKIPSEQPVPYARVNHTETENSSLIFNIETDPPSVISAYVFLADNNDNILLTENDEYLRIK